MAHNMDYDDDFEAPSDGKYTYDDEDDSDLSMLYLSTSDESDSDSENQENIAPNIPVSDKWTTGEALTPSPIPDFTGPTPGPTVALEEEYTEVDFLLLFFSMGIITLLVERTNQYAEYVQAKNGVDERWNPVTFEEMKAWIGMRVLMSVINLPYIGMYWSEHHLHGGYRLARIMARGRFNKISQYLHVSQNEAQIPRGQPGYDRLHKVRDVLEMVRRSCLKIYNPHRNVSIDEAMVAFRGRLGFRQYTPAKPTRYGIKVWMRADSDNGYVNDFQVYTGKEGRAPEVGLGTRVILDLTVPIQNRNHIVNCDNYFMSPELCQRLLNIQTFARGTVRANRKGYPKDILDPKAVKHQGEMTVAQKGQMVAVSWRDKKVVNVLSTADDVSGIRTTIPRKQRDGRTVRVPCPTVVKEYNDNMNGVDRADQLRVQLSTYRTAKKWWTYLFWLLFDTSVCNAFVMQRERDRQRRQKPKTMVKFRLALAEQLIGTFQGTRLKRPRANEEEGSDWHMPRSIPKRRRCRQCSKSKIRKESGMIFVRLVTWHSALTVSRTGTGHYSTSGELSCSDC